MLSIAEVTIDANSALNTDGCRLISYQFLFDFVCDLHKTNANITDEQERREANLEENAFWVTKKGNRLPVAPEGCRLPVVVPEGQRLPKLSVELVTQKENLILCACVCSQARQKSVKPFWSNAKVVNRLLDFARGTIQDDLRLKFLLYCTLYPFDVHALLS